jgi:hypothetical protein
MAICSQLADAADEMKNTAIIHRKAVLLLLPTTWKKVIEESQT